MTGIAKTSTEDLLTGIKVPGITIEFSGTGAAVLGIGTGVESGGDSLETDAGRPGTGLAPQGVGGDSPVSGARCSRTVVEDPGDRCLELMERPQDSTGW